MQTAAAGDTILYRFEVRVKNRSSASRVFLTDTLPAGVELVSTKVNRGSGCTGTTTLTCNLDFLSGDLVAVIEVVVRVTAAGTLVNTASVTAPEFDPDLSNNASSVTVGQPQPPLPTPTRMRPVLGKVVVLPLRPFAGRKFVLSVVTKRSDTGAPLTGARLAWITTAAGKRLIGSQSYKAGTARLSLLVPKTSIGKPLKLKLTITASGQTVTRTFTYLIA